jgi:hypothetical protein
MSKQHPTGIEHLRMQRKKEITRRKAQEARDKLRWYEANPDHPKAIAHREQALAAANLKIALQVQQESKLERIQANRLEASMDQFAACFKLAPDHPARITPIKATGASVGLSGGKWIASALGSIRCASSVVSHIKDEHDKHQDHAILHNLPRRWLGVRLKHSEDGVRAWILPAPLVATCIHHEMPPLAVFGTAGGFMALFVIRTGQILTSAKTVEKALTHINKMSKRDFSFLIKNLPDITIIKQ